MLGITWDTDMAKSAGQVMQLFSIGLWKLNPDGSEMKDANGNSIPTYGVSAADSYSPRAAPGFGIEACQSSGQTC